MGGTIYRTDPHYCAPPRTRDTFGNPRGSLFRCDCAHYWVSDGMGHWTPVFPFGPAWRRARKIERDRGES